MLGGVVLLYFELRTYHNDFETWFWLCVAGFVIVLAGFELADFNRPPR